MQIFGSRLICPRAQTCMDSNMVRADFWQLTDLPPGSNMLRRAAQTCSACKLAGVQISPLPTLANQILARTFFRSVALQLARPAVEKFCRASSAGGRLNLRSNIEQPDRVGRRGLSEPGGIFSRLPTKCCSNPWLDSAAVSVTQNFCESPIQLRRRATKQSFISVDNWRY